MFAKELQEELDKSKGRLDMSSEEAQRFAEAMSKPEFVKLFRVSFLLNLE